MKSLIRILFICLLGITACGKINNYSDTLQVHFISFSYPDTLLLFSFIDGNGDFGLSAADTLPPFTKNTNNLFISMYKKSNNQYTLIQPNFIGYRCDVPSPTGQDQTLIGQATVHMNGVMNVPSFIPDTFMLKFYIQDRAFHNSNVDSTPDLYKINIGKNIN
jgi:hypothetical protein